MHAYSRRNYFKVTWKDADGWDGTEVKTSEESQKILNEKLRKAVELVKKK